MKYPMMPDSAPPPSPDPDWSHLEWNELSRKTLHDGRLFRLLASRQRSADGREGDFTLLECPDWVNVVALNTRSREPSVLMVRQYRFGGGKVSLEFPGGVVDPGEGHGTAARRELLEETGCQAKTWIYLGGINPNPAFMTNTTHSWLALDLDVDPSRTDLDALELLAVQHIPLATLMDGLKDFETNGVMMCTWYWFRRWLDQNPL